MKLINKTQRIYMILVIGLLSLWSVIFMFAIFSAIEENIDETLRSELAAHVSQLKNENLSPVTATPQMTITPIPAVRDTAITLSDTTLFNSVEQEDFPYRQAYTQVQIAGQAYQIIMRRSMVEYDDLFETILTMELIFVLLLLIGLYTINNKILERLWHPFYDTLQKVTHYEIGRPTDIKWEKTKIDEFRQLNEVLQDMMHQIEREYRSLKQFTENASHEIQTPLSVISGKVEILLQDESLTNEQGKNINAIHHATGKLSRLNKALLMLTKIENEQFDKAEKVNLSSLLTDLIRDYRTLAQSKNITIYEHLQSKVQIDMNADLAELMVRNLLGNAVKHNIDGGYIKTSLDEGYLTIKNTGKMPIDEPQTYFERFRKDPHSTSSLGLGLSIVAAITKANDFDLEYTTEKDIHVLRVIFP